MHQNIYVLRTSKLKTRPGCFDSSDWLEDWVPRRSQFVGRAVPGHRRFLPPRAVDTRFVFACSANESAKRFAGDVEAVVGEPLPDLSVRLSRTQRGFNFN
jgi:hypothetical protein